MSENILQPEKMLIEAGLHRDSVVADFGCGPGMFSIPAAGVTRERVHCFDVMPKTLEALKSKASTMRIFNLEIHHTNLEKPYATGFEDGVVDMVIMRKIISQSSAREALFAEAYRILKEGGILFVVGWRKDALIGPDVETRISEEEMRALGKAQGFDKINGIVSDTQHYALSFCK